MKPSPKTMLAAASCVYTTCPPSLDGFTLKKRTTTMAVYEDPTQKRILVSVRGVNPTKLKDLTTAVKTVTQQFPASDRYQSDLQIVREFRREYPNHTFYFTGHSLGGATAQQMMRDIQGEAAMVFNSAYQYPLDEQQPDPGRVTRYHIDGDFLTPVTRNLRSSKKVLPYPEFRARQAACMLSGAALPLCHAANTIRAHGIDRFKRHKDKLRWS
jgi:hypothetical protein